MSGESSTGLRHRAGQRADLWLALLAGPMPWVDPDRKARGLETAAVGMEVLAALTMLSWSALDLGDRGATARGKTTDGLLLGALVVLTALLVGPMVVWVATGRKLIEGLWARPRLVAVLRSTVAVGAALAWSLRTPRAVALAAWPFGVALGCEVALTAWAIGMVARPLLWWRRFMVTGPHLGSIAALVAVAVGRREAGAWRPALSLYLTLHVVVGLTAITVWLLDRTRIRFERELERRELFVLEEEHRRRAHWLHDEVCTRLGFVQQRVGSGALDPSSIASELRLLDHTLRERQLEELLGAGSVELADVVQPYLRMAQQQGVRLVAVPSYEDTVAVVDAQTGHRVKRVLANLVGNSIKAGATELGVRTVVSHGSGGVVEVTISDNAGGFDPGMLTPGRGLDRLSEELGRENLTFERTADGMTIRAMIPTRDPRHLRVKQTNRKGA